MSYTLRQTKSSINDAVKNVRAYWNLKTCTTPPVIIYQMGKVGSSSIKHSLKLSGKHPIFHTHSIGPGYEEKFISRILYSNIIVENKKAKFISLVREPIGRNISAFFENFKIVTGMGDEEANFTIQELTEIFLKSYPHEVPLEWFDRNIKSTLGIDVYEHSFKEKGVLSVQNDNFDLLVIKSEIDNSIKEKYVSDFLNIKDFKIINVNEGTRKTYAKTYQSFLKNAKLPRFYIKEMCNSRYFKHFYSDNEIQDVISKWTSN